MILLIFSGLLSNFCGCFFIVFFIVIIIIVYCYVLLLCFIDVCEEKKLKKLNKPQKILYIKFLGIVVRGIEFREDTYNFDLNSFLSVGEEHFLFVLVVMQKKSETDGTKDETKNIHQERKK